MKSKKLLNSFTKYCKENKVQRFWQALRNWSKYDFIYGSKQSPNKKLIDLEDTFYKE